MATEIKVGRLSVTSWLLWDCLTSEVQRKLRALVKGEPGATTAGHIGKN